MVQTRSQGQVGTKETRSSSDKKHVLKEKQEPKAKKPRRGSKDEKPKGASNEKATKESLKAENGGNTEKKEDIPLSASALSKIQKFISEHGTLPLEDAGLADPDKPTPETVLAYVLDSLLKATRISHNISDGAVHHLIKSGYQDVQKLKNSTWEERAEVLTEGGYSRYREKTATELGDLADLLLEKYDGDLNNLVKEAPSSRDKIRAAVKEIKGVGDIAVDIFFTSIQHLWTDLAPWIEPRSLETAKRLGIGKDVEAIYDAVKRDPREMCKLSRALAQVRLEKEEKEFE